MVGIWRVVKDLERRRAIEQGVLPVAMSGNIGLCKGEDEVPVLFIGCTAYEGARRGGADFRALAAAAARVLVNGYDSGFTV